MLIVKAFYKNVQYIMTFCVLTISFAICEDKIIPINVDDMTVIIIEKTPPTTYLEITYNTVTSPYTGKVWLDRNIGASRVCLYVNDAECYGYYFQWGRNYDGHQNPNSSISNILATNIFDAGNQFIISDINNNWDWTTLDKDGKLRSENWSKIDGSSVCPIGFRVPTISELEAELINVGSSEIKGAQDAFNSFLKLSLAGYRSGYSAQIINPGNELHLLSTSPAYYIYIEKDLAYTGPYAGQYGYAGTVRCIKNQ